MDFAVPAEHRVKNKESDKWDKYLDLAWELRKLWNMRVTVIPIVIDALGTFLKGLERKLIELERGRVLKAWGDLLSLRLQWKTATYIGVKKLTRSEKS